MSDIQDAKEIARLFIEERKQNKSSNQRDSHKTIPKSKSQYINESGCLYHVSIDKSGNTLKKLVANFFPVPQCEIRRDDGEDTELFFELGGTIAGGRPLPLAQIPAAQFHSMAWVEKSWGLSANIEPGNSSRDRVRHAIQEQATNIPRTTIYTHTGWRNINESWDYLHAGGALRNSDISVDLTEAGLDRYVLPEPGGEDAVNMSLCFLDVAPRKITIPLWSLCYLAPLTEALRQTGNEPSFLVWLAGITGAGKSSLAAVLLSHFGRFTNKSLPASFKDTANFLERRAFILKDSLLVVDDYHPTNSGSDASKMEATAQSLCRLFGDRTGKGRLSSDIRIRKSKPARCLALVTGEDTPTLGESGAARILTLELDKDDLDFDQLSTLQDSSELLRQSMAGYLQWLALHFSKLPNRLMQVFLKRRELAQSGGHKRMPETAAWLYIGLMMGLEYVISTGAMSEQDAIELREAGWQAILELCRKQGQRITEERPSIRFIGILKELLASEGAVVEKLTGFEEEGRIIFDNNGKENKPFIGWQDENWLYLLPEQTFKTISKFCRDQGTRFPVTANTLWKNLDNDGLIEVEATNSERRRKIQKTINGSKHRVIKLNMSSLNN